MLGKGVEQKGSLVDAEKLRFDFSFQGAVPPDQLRRIERMVNEQVVANLDVSKNEKGFDEAVEAGAIALFGEKYGARVRVVAVEDGPPERRSVELCGGTHVARTGDIGAFKIVSEGGVAAGVRRIEAVTGLKTLDFLQQRDDLVRAAAAALKSSVEGCRRASRPPQDELKKLAQGDREKAGKLPGSGVEIPTGCSRRLRRSARSTGSAGQSTPSGDALLRWSTSGSWAPAGSVLVLVGKERRQGAARGRVRRGGPESGRQAGGSSAGVAAGELGGAWKSLARARARRAVVEGALARRARWWRRLRASGAHEAASVRRRLMIAPGGRRNLPRFRHGGEVAPRRSRPLHRTRTDFRGEWRDSAPGEAMAVPKKKTSRHRKGKRRSHHHLMLPSLSRCSRCGKACRPHAICDACGYTR